MVDLHHHTYSCDTLDEMQLFTNSIGGSLCHQTSKGVITRLLAHNDSQAWDRHLFTMR